MVHLSLELSTPVTHTVAPECFRFTKHPPRGIRGKNNWMRKNNPALGLWPPGT